MAPMHFIRADKALKYAQHRTLRVASDDWDHKYSRQHAAFPAPWLKDFKFWPYVGRVDNPYGDRNLFCTCVPVTAHENES